MKAIVIDPYTRSIFTEELPDIPGDDNGRDSYAMLKAAVFKGQMPGIIQSVQVGHEQVMWVDEEALLRPWQEQAFFRIHNNPPIGGRGVITDIDEEGGTLPCTGSLRPVWQAITWVKPEDVVVPAPTIAALDPETMQAKGEGEPLDGGPAVWNFTNHGGRR